MQGYSVTVAKSGIKMRPPPTLLQAMESQLGLKIPPKKVAVAILVIDHAEKTPVEN